MIVRQSCNKVCMSFHVVKRTQKLQSFHRFFKFSGTSACGKYYFSQALYSCFQMQEAFRH